MRTILMLICGSLAWAQPSFEVASVKVAQPNTTFHGCRGGPDTTAPGMWTCGDVSLVWVIMQAYDLQRYQINPPDWMLGARFDLAARIAPGTTKHQFQQMQQDLLAKRFHMQVHFEPKEMPVFELTVARPGLLPANHDPPPDREFVPGPMNSLDGRVSWKVTDVSLEEMVRVLALQFGGPISDATGLKGRYDVSLSWYAEISPAARHALEELGETVTAGEGGPSLRQALQDQLGLKLQSKKGPVQVLVIDHVDKVPAEN